MDPQSRQKEKHRESILEQVEEIRSGPGDSGCPHCGQPVKSSWEWCPSCGHSLVDWCTFCGADIPRGEDECPECGMSREGVVCPKCGTRNVSGFCRKCNEPLTLAAKKELERALEDPLFVKAADLAVRAAELQRRIDAADEEPVQEEKIEERLPEDILRLKELLGKALRQGPAPRQAKGPDKIQAQKPKSKAELRAEYARLQEEIKSTLAKMLPPAGSTPQEQRNYFSARKLPVEKIIMTKGLQAWICNFCGCWHNRPSECCEPWRGGKWVYEYKEEKILDFQ